MTTILDMPNTATNESVYEAIENLEHLAERLESVSDAGKLRKAIERFMPAKHIKLIIEELQTKYPDKEISRQHVQNIWSGNQKDNLGVFSIAIKLAIPVIKGEVAMMKDLKEAKELLSAI